MFYSKYNTGLYTSQAAEYAKLTKFHPSFSAIPCFSTVFRGKIIPECFGAQDGGGEK
ncbi:hypothetical protein [Chordicoccus furentiruminis]|uniref:hypothetical protein n=1 Tax=Chordicoccus furentiruminis TaxID=2709410 RepID=UPI0023A7F43D|nr:hypothetical protein [Chordicoccus furentiruminis]